MSNYLKFWGTRGTCAVSGSQYAYFGGNTSCLEVRYDKTHILIDAGTGVRPAGASFLEEGILKIDLFLSHFHLDHIIGFPYFELLYEPNAEITLWTPKSRGRSSQEILQDLFSPEFFPITLKEIKARIHHKTIEENKPVKLGPLTLDFHRTHHPGVTLCFKIQTPHETIGYVTDNEALPGHTKLIDFLKGCDVLVHEAQYFPEEYLKKAKWGHSSALNAAAFVEKIGSPKWLVVHHDPKHIDLDLERLFKLTQKALPNTHVEWVFDSYILPLK